VSRSAARKRRESIKQNNSRRGVIIMSTRLKKSLQVFGCLGILLAFLFLVFYPIFVDLRENAWTQSCHGNLKTLGAALAQYSADNDDALPAVTSASGRTWRETLLVYVKDEDIYHCPKRDDFADAHGIPQNYAANACRKGAFAGTGLPPLTRRDYFEPTKLIMLAETENNPRPDFDIDDPVLFGLNAHKLWAGHFSVHSNFLFADGHVKSLFPDMTALYDSKNHSLFNYWYRSPDTRLSPNGEKVLQETAKEFQRTH